MMEFWDGLNTEKSKALYERSCRTIQLGASSSARAYPIFDPYPICFDHGKGQFYWDLDKNKYLDFVLAYGPLIHGHCPDKVIDAVKKQMEKGTMCGQPTEIGVTTAEKLKKVVPNTDFVRFSNTGTEATMHAIRIARGYTAKDKIVKFEGAYHGVHDYALVSIHQSGGSPLAPTAIPESLGIPESSLKNTIILPWNNLETLERTISRKANEIAAVIIEPISMNYGVALPQEDYLKGVREITEKHGVLMIMDEVITGFRLALGGAQEYFGISADLATFGKALGAGFPIAAITGRREVMEMIRPGAITHMGTYNENPLCVAAAQASITQLEAGGIERIRKLGEMLLEEIQKAIEKTKIEAIVQGLGPVFQVYFTKLKKIERFRDTLPPNCDFQKSKRFQKELLRRGVYFHPDLFERNFICTAHTEDDIRTAVSAITDSFRALMQ
jgi:glutamate-1-semialdehyde 2,1-aminomutase